MRRQILSAALILTATPALAQGLPQQSIPHEGDPGFRVEIQGVPDDLDRDSFVEAVLGALPQPLLDPSQNFTRSEIYDRGDGYRLLMVFHAPGGEIPNMDMLCRREAGQPPMPDAEPPAMTDLTTTTRIAAAFCRGTETLSTAVDQMTGQVTPDQASFRFLVADVAKQLFPGGFAQIPGTPAAPVGALP